MNVQPKIKRLTDLFHLYDQYIESEYLSCNVGCAHCCTVNVTLTSLEGAHILNYLKETQQINLLSKIYKMWSVKRFSPRLSINRLARYCKEQKEIPADDNDPSWGRCGFLFQEKCLIYPVRPFACRCMISSESCSKNGSATISEFILTLNDLFLQIIEHLDQEGSTGNLIDILIHTDLETPNHPKSRPNRSEVNNRVTPNEAVTILMIPPEFQTQIRPILEKIHGLEIK